METVGRDIKDVKNDPRNELKIDINFTKGKLFMSLMKNLPKMFPNDMLSSEIEMEDFSVDMNLIIKKTDENMKRKER